MVGLIITSIVCGTAAAVLFALYCKDHKNIRLLREKVLAFSVDQKTILDIPLKENNLANLQNEILILEEQLILSREMAQEERRRIEKMAADISHQLKTPLTALRLYTEMDEAPHQSSSLQQIDRMEELISNLLRLEKLKADSYSFRFIERELNSLIREQWEILQPVFKERSFFIKGEATIRVDERWLGEAILNLLKNACEHTENGGYVRVTIEETEISVFIIIEDDGGGVNQQELPCLFERFYRAEHQSKDGVGIGLAIVKEVIFRHHGTVSAENGKEGLKVTMVLPKLESNLAKT